MGVADRRIARRTKISTPEATGRRIRELLGPSYGRAHVFTVDADCDVSATADGRLRVRRGRPTRTPVPLEHNRAKSHLLSEHEPTPFLVEIGVMTPAGKVKASKQAKFRQINRFLELVERRDPLSAAERRAPRRRLRQRQELSHVCALSLARLTFTVGRCTFSGSIAGPT